MDLPIRPAGAGDADAIARLVNLAYEAERFFVLGDRTDASDVLTHMARGLFLVAAEPGGAGLVGCVHVEPDGEVGSFGMLAVDPAWQRTGVGRRLIDTAEAHIRRAGAHVVEIHVVNVRDDLLPRYRRLGYVEVGTAPYVHRPTIQPVHFVVMRKAL